MSSLCHPPCKSPRRVITEKSPRGFTCVDLWFGQRHKPFLHGGLQEDREAHISFSTSFQGNSRHSSNCLQHFNSHLGKNVLQSVGSLTQCVKWASFIFCVRDRVCWSDRPVFGVRDQNMSVAFALELFLYFGHNIYRAYHRAHVVCTCRETGPILVSTQRGTSFARENCSSFKRRNCELILYKEIPESNHGPFQMSN